MHYASLFAHAAFLFTRHIFPNMRYASLFMHVAFSVCARGITGLSPYAPIYAAVFWFMHYASFVYAPYFPLLLKVSLTVLLSVFCRYQDLPIEPQGIEPFLRSPPLAPQKYKENRGCAALQRRYRGFATQLWCIFSETVAVSQRSHRNFAMKLSQKAAAASRYPPQYPCGKCQRPYRKRAGRYEKYKE